MEANNQHQVLQACSLFRRMAQSELEARCAQGGLYSRSYARDEVVAFEKDLCNTVQIIDITALEKALDG